MTTYRITVSTWYKYEYDSSYIYEYTFVFGTTLTYCTDEVNGVSERRSGTQSMMILLYCCRLRILMG